MRPRPTRRPLRETPSRRCGRDATRRRADCVQARLQRAPVDTATLVAAPRPNSRWGSPRGPQRLEKAAEARPDDLAVRDALMRLLEPSAITPRWRRSSTASYDDWNGGKVTRTRPADLIAIATAVRLDGNWKDTNDVLRDAVRAEPARDGRQPRLGRRAAAEAQRRRRGGGVQGRAEGRPRQPRRPRRPGARRGRRSLRRRHRARGDRPRAGGQPGPRGRAGAAC